MRTRALILIALLAPLPAELSGQVVRPPRTGGRTPVDPAPSTREIPVVARALAIQRSRWSAEAYTLISSVQVPAANGAATSYSNFGSGTHADYRFTDRFSATVDMTYSPLGSVATTGTAEIGTRFKPMPFDEEIRPFFDIRMGFMYLNDRYALPSSLSQQFAEGNRYSRGGGALAGAGIEYSVSNSLSISTEVLALQNRMTTYRLTNPTTLPTGTAYSMTSFRLTLGLRYNASRSMHLSQNPRS